MELRYKTIKSNRHANTNIHFHEQILTRFKRVIFKENKLFFNPAATNLIFIVVVKVSGLSYTLVPDNQGYKRLNFGNTRVGRLLGRQQMD